MPAWPRGRLVVAFSGGVDSVALLAALVALRDGASAESQVRSATKLPRCALSLRAIHVDHGLSSHSREWARICKRQCAALAVPLSVRRVSIPRARRQSLEAEARRARYAALRRGRARDEILLTAHHLDDQFETILLQLFRGAGVAGLAGITPDGELDGRRLLRPLLDVPRVELESYVRGRGLSWIEDESNANLRFDRNYLRHRVVPQILARWPGAAVTATRGAAHLAQARTVLDELAAEDLARVRLATDAIDVRALNQLSAPRRAQTLRAWIRDCDLPPPDAAQLSRLLRDLPAVRADANPELHWPGAHVRRYRGVLYLEPDAAAPPTLRAERLRWRGREALVLGPGLGELRLRRDARGDIAAPPARAAQPWLVRLPRPGERIEPASGTSAFRLAERLRELGVLPWRRALLPLVLAGRRCVAIGGISGAALAGAAPSRGRYRLEWIGGPRVLACSVPQQDVSAGVQTRVATQT